ncbi:Serine/threonine protein kinase [Malassezia sp. CBS 17886]|nr:Serine/threonine protein kinase [Malassezia sp. CBS 17886]
MSSLSTQQHRNLIGSRIADGRLEFVSVLGLGAYGVVYLARDTTHRISGDPLGRHTLKSGCGSAVSGYYAVKCLNKTGLDNRQRSFQRRETLLHTIASSHPSVVTLHRVIDNPQDPHVFVVLDYCPDGDLFSMITGAQRYFVPPEAYVPDIHAGDGRPSPQDPAYTSVRMAMDTVIKDVFDQLLDAVEHCHRAGIYHRDLKPENVLCLHGGRRVVLADFGLATGDKWSADFGCGSSFYMGPECQGGIATRLEQYSTEANDVWSLGVILINLICGRNPWKQATPSDETFCEYLRNPDFIMHILPISDDTNAVLKRVFTVRPEARCSVRELRAWVRAIPRFCATNMEMWQRHHAAPPVPAHMAMPEVSHTPPLDQNPQAFASMHFSMLCISTSSDGDQALPETAAANTAEQLAAERRASKGPVRPPSSAVSPGADASHTPRAVLAGLPTETRTACAEPPMEARADPPGVHVVPDKTCMRADAHGGADAARSRTPTRSTLAPIFCPSPWNASQRTPNLDAQSGTSHSASDVDNVITPVSSPVDDAPPARRDAPDAFACMSGSRPSAMLGAGGIDSLWRQPAGCNQLVAQRQRLPCFQR